MIAAIRQLLLMLIALVPLTAELSAQSAATATERASEELRRALPLLASGSYSKIGDAIDIIAGSEAGHAAAILNAMAARKLLVDRAGTTHLAAGPDIVWHEPGQQEPRPAKLTASGFQTANCRFTSMIGKFQTKNHHPGGEFRNFAGLSAK